MPAARLVALALGAVAGLLMGCGGGSALEGRVGEPRRVDNFALLDHQGVYRELYRQADARAIVLYAYGMGCPIARGNLPALRDLASAYRQRGVAVWLVDSQPQDDRGAVAREAEAWTIDLPILLDEAQLVMRGLAIERLAEAIVIDPATWTVVHRGSLDDSRDYEAQKARPTRQPVVEALDALLAGDTVDVAPEPVRGCLIFDQVPHDAEPTYTADVAPILARRCLVCHRPEGAAPWAMSDYGAVRGWSPMMREVIRTRRMPPWHADPHIGRFANDLSLSADEARTIVRWVDHGAPRGDGDDPLPALAVAPPSSWPMGEPDLLLPLPEQAIPASGVLDYRYIDLTIPTGGPLWVRGVDFRPSNRTVLHHALAHVIYPPDHPRAAAHWQDEMFAGYAPGIDNHFFPAGTGRTVPAGAVIRVEVHYITTGREENDRPELAIYLGDEPPRHELHTRGPARTDLDIPPGAVDHEVATSFTFERDAVLYALLPHMHYRGSRIRYEARYADGRRETLLSVPNYRFTWQRYYVLAEPKVLAAGTEIVVTGAFDNSPQNPWNPDPTARVHWGPQSTDEMLIGYLEYAYRPGVKSASIPD